MAKSASQVQIDVLSDPLKTDEQRYMAYDTLVDGLRKKRMTITLRQFNQVADTLCAETDATFISSLHLLAGQLRSRPRHKFPHDQALLTILEKTRFFFSDNYEAFNCRHKLFSSERSFDLTRFILSQTAQMMIEKAPRASLTEDVGKKICDSAISTTSIDIDPSGRVICRGRDTVQMNTLVAAFARRAAPKAINQVTKFCIHHARPEVTADIIRATRAIEVAGLVVSELLWACDPQTVRKLHCLTKNPNASQSVVRQANILHRLLTFRC